MFFFRFLFPFLIQNWIIQALDVRDVKAVDHIERMMMDFYPCPRTKTNSSAQKNDGGKRILSFPIGSMGMVYLPRFR